MDLNYKQQKIILFGMTGFFPILFFVIALFFVGDLFTSLILACLSSIGFIFIGHVGTSQNPFVKAIQDGKVLIIDSPSTGIANFYNAEVSRNEFGDGIDIKTDLGETRAYDRIVTSLLSQPFLAKLFYKKSVSGVGSENKIVVELSNDDYKQAAWYYKGLTILFYNSQIGSFVTKPLMSVQEKELLAEYLSLNEARELRQLNKTFLGLMRHTFDLIADRFSRIFGNPMFQVLLVILVLIVLGYAAYQFLPNISGVTSGAVSNISGAVAEPLTIGG